MFERTRSGQSHDFGQFTRRKTGKRLALCKKLLGRLSVTKYDKPAAELDPTRERSKSRPVRGKRLADFAVTGPNQQNIYRVITEALGWQIADLIQFDNLPRELSGIRVAIGKCTFETRRRRA